MAHPFTGYNKYEDNPVLVGNWVEEHALRTSTGQHRYKSWTKVEDNEDSVYPKHIVPPRMETFGRVFEHSDKLEPVNWITHYRSTYSAGSGAYREPTEAGKRSSMRMTKALKEALQEPPQEPELPDFTTTAKAAFTEKEMKGLHIGARVMKTQDGFPVKRDPVFLSETKIVDKYRAEKLCGRTSDAKPPEEAPVTYYSEYTNEE